MIETKDSGLEKRGVVGFCKRNGVSRLARIGRKNLEEKLDGKGGKKREFGWGRQNVSKKRVSRKDGKVDFIIIDGKTE